MIHTEKKIKHATNGFDQLLLFSISNEVLNKQGKWSIYTIDRTVRIYYVGMIDSLHKYVILFSLLLVDQNMFFVSIINL